MNVFIRTIEVIVIKKVLPNNKKNLKEEKKGSYQTKFYRILQYT